jgi:uncharacterized protein (TIGR03437 family)
LREIPLLKQIIRIIAIVGVLISGAVRVGSQGGTASVAFTGIPAWGQNGAVSGAVYGTTLVASQLYLFEFIPDVGWYLAGGCGPVTVQSTGQFSVSMSGLMDGYATRFTAYLIPASLGVPCIEASGTIPFLIQQNAIGSATIPRLPQYNNLSFGGLNWSVKTAPLQVYPGPQFYVQPNAFVDNAGLHLRLTQCSGSWCGAEVYSNQAIGYGTYTFTVSSPLNNLDPNVTLGLFTWDAMAGDQNFREWDIEFGRWGNPSATANAQYVVQPYNGPNNISRFLMSPAGVSTHTVTWLPNDVQFASTSGGALISEWNYPGTSLTVPTTGDAHLHMNFYIAAGGAPKTPVNQEIIISNFQYTPVGSQIGFTRNADSTSFIASTVSVPVTASSGSCSATVESDSPWLTVSSGPVFGGGAVRYSVPDNVGPQRTGNLILRSTNCNATLGYQTLSVTQPGFTCSPTFWEPSTSIGFLQGLRSVFIRATASECSWSVSSVSPWIHIVSSPSGSGDGNVQFSADSNVASIFRQGALSLNNGQTHLVNQDASGSLLALSPSSAVQCGNQPPQFGISWIAPGNVELRLGSPTGQLIGQFGSYGTTLLPQIGDGTLIYLLGSGSAQILGSATANISGTNCAAPAIQAGGILNAASIAPLALAPGALGVIKGANLSAGTATATTIPYPSSLGGVTVSLSGQACPLLYVSSNQINFQVPPGLPAGRYVISVGGATSEVIVNNVSPGIFTVNENGTGVPFAAVIGKTAQGPDLAFSPYQCGASGCMETAIALPNNLTELLIVLYGTGINGARSVSASFGSIGSQVVYFGAVNVYPGLDQVNVVVPNPGSLTGHQMLTLIVDGIPSNTVDLLFQ